MKSDQYRLASVLVIIYGNPANIIMTRKPQSMKYHAGEISFPGGKFDSDDADLLHTAIREASEEIGLSITLQQVIGQLDTVVTLNSGFMILPFITILDEIPALCANSEVEEILHIPLWPFLKTMAVDPDPEHNKIKGMHIFKYQNHIVWGASSRILQQIKNRLNFQSLM